ncbi:hypothetical protein KZ686_22160 [Cupriavidus cauae]|uniref:hypothetical protein n=1 Tax=Cupriavidus cauae TaxID=2608999 RepID=UPI002242F072|nr:hypothetical protein [Cupriavidus cauae]UZN51066.1 hypothetical protein KZ686_22160 [Cupriavidus cauae]
MPINACGSVVRETQREAFQPDVSTGNHSAGAAMGDTTVRRSHGLLQPERASSSRVEHVAGHREPIGGASGEQWPPGFATHARLAQAREWHLLNEVTYAIWGGATTGRAGLQVSAFATGKFDTLSITSLAPATSEAGVAGAVFAIVEAAGVLHLTWKAGRKKVELDECKRQNAQGHAHFVQRHAERQRRIGWLLARQRALEGTLPGLPASESSDQRPHAGLVADDKASAAMLADVALELRDVRIGLEKQALDLVEDLEHYILYEQAANELGQANDNIRALGVATARDVVIQLGGSACTVASAVGKAGVPGVELAPVGVAGGAFSVAMGALHMAAGFLSWYQSARRLDDIRAARGRGSNWLTSDYRRQRAAAIADAFHETRSEMAFGTPNSQADGAALQSAEQTQRMQQALQPGPSRRADIERANELVDILMHHREQAFQTIESAERRKIWWSRLRTIYGAVSVGIGVGAILATTAFGLIPPVGIIVGAVALLAGTVWLLIACVRLYQDRRAGRAESARDEQARAQVGHFVEAKRDATVDDMRNNRFLAIDVLLRALFDHEQPVARGVLWEVLAALEMDRALIHALELRSSVRLDSVYADDRRTMIERARCCASAIDEAALKKVIEGMSLRSDDAMLALLRQLFQDFIEGKTPMRLEYQRRTGFFAYLAGQLPAGVRSRLGLGSRPAARPAPALAVTVQASEATERTALIAEPDMPMLVEPSPVAFTDAVRATGPSTQTFVRNGWY